MLQPSEHIAQAEKNERLYELLVGTEFNDWAITGLFYAALHYVDAFFMRQTGTSPINHNSRNGLVERTLNLAQIKPYYAALFQWSLNVRYEAIQVSSDDARYVMAQYFTPLRQHIRALLNLP